FAEFSNNPLIDTLKISIFILISVLLLFFIVKNTSKSFISVIFIAFFVRIIVVFIMSFFGFIPYQYDNNWELVGATLLSDWHSGNIHFNINNNKVSFYSGLTTVVYYLFGENPIYMQLLNVFFSTLAIIYLFKMSRYLFNYKVAFYSSVIMSIWPTYIFFTSMHMREALAIFFLLAFAYYFMKWLRYFKFKYIILAAFSFLFDMLIRPQNGMLIIISIFPFIVFYAWKYSSKYMKINLVVFSFFAGLGILFILQLTGYLRFDFNYIVTEMSYRTGGGSSYLEWMTYNSLLDLIIYSPIRLVYFVYTPFPWQITSMEQAFAFLESVLLIIMSYHILRGLKVLWETTERKRELFFIIVFCLLGLIANGLVDSNVGTSIRHKLQYIFVFFILVSAVKSQIGYKIKRATDNF